MAELDAQRRDAALAEIRDEYARRTDRFEALDPAGRWMFDRLMARRHREYARLLARNGLAPLGERRVLDVGSGRNEWLLACRQEFGHTGDDLCGIELLPERVAAGRAAFPYLKLQAGSADALPWDDARFDLVHQGMLASSIADDELRRRIVTEMRRVTRPGGHVLWYDFIWNPLNRAARGISLGEAREYFGGWRLVDHCRATLAPPVARRLIRVWEPLADWLERAGVLNCWELALFEKPGDAGR